MTYRLLLDEMVEHGLYHRLERSGHDVEHVEFHANLGKGVLDETIAEYSRQSERILVTYDDDFVTKVPESRYEAVIFVADETLPARQVASGIDGMADYYPQTQVSGVVDADEWIQ